MVQACVTCDIVSDMHAIGMDLSKNVYAAYGKDLKDVIKAGAVAYIFSSVGEGVVTSPADRASEAVCNTDVVMRRASKQHQEIVLGERAVRTADIVG